MFVFGIVAKVIGGMVITGFVMYNLDQGCDPSENNIHLNKVTNGQWHQWIAGDTSGVK